MICFDHIHNMRKSSLRQSVLPMMLLLLSACSGSGSQPAADSLPTEEYHADNDIVMTINSVIDAISVGEPIDSAAYDYEAVLTDGSGRPLYTDLQGAPGVWDIMVEKPHTVVIRNAYLGDLLSSDLEQYIVSQVRASEFRKVYTDEFDDDDETDVSIYDFGAGTLRFETRVGRTTNGLEGPLLSIRIQATKS